jgi:tRNA G18 (ribose-2'-O)-methylase SpoU
MYNNLMPSDSSQIRTCVACGLRYPLLEANTFGTRCPACLGETRLTLQIGQKPDTDHARSPNSDSPRAAKRDFAVLLDNIRSAWNVGSIFRSADGFGFGHAYLCGITPTPDIEAVTKTSLGAEGTVPWSYHKDAVKLVRGLKKEGWQVWSLEDDPRALPISTPLDAQRHLPVILIMGNEITGVDPELRDLADQIFYIPMHGEKTSFNVAIAFAIAAYQFRYLRLRA